MPLTAAEAVSRTLSGDDQIAIASLTDATSPAGRALQELLDSAHYSGRPQLRDLWADWPGLVNDPLTRYAAVALVALNRPVVYESVLEIASRAGMMMMTYSPPVAAGGVVGCCPNCDELVTELKPGEWTHVDTLDPRCRLYAAPPRRTENADA